MRNANQADIVGARKTGILREDVMYGVLGDSCLRVHGKRVGNALSGLLLGTNAGDTIVETSDGELILIRLHDVRAIPRKGPTRLPKRPRRKPVKGTRPEQRIPYEEYIAKYGEFKGGEAVLLSTGAREKIDPFAEKFGDCWIISFGKVVHPKHITHVILTYKEEPTNTCVVTHEDIVKALSSESVVRLIQQEVKKTLIEKGAL